LAKSIIGPWISGVKDTSGFTQIVVEAGGPASTVGKEMPISRIVIAVPNATVVLLD
jgi:hypothetical protein